MYRSAGAEQSVNLGARPTATLRIGVVHVACLCVRLSSPCDYCVITVGAARNKPSAMALGSLAATQFGIFVLTCWQFMARWRFVSATCLNSGWAKLVQVGTCVARLQVRAHQSVPSSALAQLM